MIGTVGFLGVVIEMGQIWIGSAVACGLCLPLESGIVRQLPATQRILHDIIVEGAHGSGGYVGYGGGHERLRLRIGRLH